ncbi:GNAT family N-acetyltransferase [Bradyrhizobium erythrophlei]|uniref:Acetyltransferase (GNAT) domain-containing protein n=1 Tax=Bradyrhizobium erythrophlei TaxID=1437360 RepID=A0A1M7UH98_9BRAD|nr:GNAT family N-acetyltransferase [Bradyrhizobium erythrophlei]SHN82401.1 Acetyltransferase (GNAT) domain-containing protein [Bradyrhizobium erythrophlei]
MTDVGGFSILKPTDPRWDVLFNALPSPARDIFYSAGFARLCAKMLPPSEMPVCAAFSSGAGDILLYPFVVRDLAALVDSSISKGLQDTISLYGRGGVVGCASPDALKAFHQSLARYMFDQRVLCSFDRFHPVMLNHTLAVRNCEIIDVGGFVVVDLLLSPQALRESFKSSVRKDLRKAERNGITCFAEANCSHLVDFLEIYYQTMERNSANAFYFFPEVFFKALPTELPGQFHFFYAVHEGRIVSCELVLHHGRYSHSFLGGTRREYLPLAANPLLKEAIFHEMKQLGCEFFFLGGGQRANDSIFSFKHAYAPDGVLASLVGGTIWRHDEYEGLKLDMIQGGREISPNRFQFYDRQ